METTPSSQNVTIKVILTFVLMFIDLILNSFVEASFTLSSNSLYYTNFYFLPIQMVVTGLTFIMVLVLLWQTFPLRYGLISVLFKEFKWTFLVILLHICLTCAERGIKLTFVVFDMVEYSEIALWSNQLYLVFYYLRFLLYPFFYGFLITFCLRIIHPSFYKPNKWLK